MTRKIAIFDTTLRDGEQSPGASMNTEEKLIIARQLIRMNVDVIEAGFPISSPGDFKSVAEIGRIAGDRCTVCGLTRAVDKDIEVAAEALKTAKRPRIHTGLGVSPSHLRDKLHLTEDEAIERAVHAVKLARNFVDDVEFYAEDAGRADQDFLVRIVEAAVKAGATVVNIPDTTGYNLPWHFGQRIRDLRERVDGIEDVTISVHTHNDLGMATALALESVRNGATQIECTVNGLGERAGNTSLEEVVMAIRMHGEELDAHTDIVTQELTHASRLVSSITGIMVQPNKAIVGANAFAHESGIHQHGVIANAQTYEIMKSTDVGIPKNTMVLGKHSGKHALREKLESMGYELTDEELSDVFKNFKELADKKKTITGSDIEALVLNRRNTAAAACELVSHVVNAGDGLPNTSCVKIKRDDKVLQEVAIGSGPLDASFKAINRMLHMDVKLDSFSLNAVTDGEDAIGEAVVKISDESGKTFTGTGLSTDIIESSIRAYVNGINKMIDAAS